MKDIKNYEGLYGITSCGKVWSYRNKKFLEPWDNGNGYLLVTLCKDNQKKNYKIHRLVAEAYLPNPENLPQINHKDENKANNCLQNLEWCDAKYNVNYGNCIERSSSKHKKAILQFTLDGEFIREWECASDVGKEVQSNICHCLKGKYKSAYGFVWKYKE